MKTRSSGTTVPARRSESSPRGSSGSRNGDSLGSRIRRRARFYKPPLDAGLVYAPDLALAAHARREAELGVPLELSSYFVPRRPERTFVERDVAEFWLRLNDPSYEVDLVDENGKVLVPRSSDAWHGSMPKGIAKRASLEQRLEDDERPVLDAELALDPFNVIVELEHELLEGRQAERERRELSVWRLVNQATPAELDELPPIDRLLTRMTWWKVDQRVRRLERSYNRAIKRRVCATPDCDNVLTKHTHRGHAIYCSERCRKRAHARLARASR